MHFTTFDARSCAVGEWMRVVAVALQILISHNPPLTKLGTLRPRTQRSPRVRHAQPLPIVSIIIITSIIIVDSRQSRGGGGGGPLRVSAALT